MDLNEDQLQRIIETNPGEFAVYRLENDVLRTLYYSPGLPACSGMDTETYSALSREDAAVLILENDRGRVRRELQKVMAANAPPTLTIPFASSTKRAASSGCTPKRA